MTEIQEQWFSRTLWTWFQVGTENTNDILEFVTLFSSFQWETWFHNHHEQVYYWCLWERQDADARGDIRMIKAFVPVKNYNLVKHSWTPKIKLVDNA